MAYLTATRIYLVRRMLTEALISLEAIEDELEAQREEVKGERMSNKELLEKMYREAKAPSPC